MNRWTLLCCVLFACAGCELFSDVSQEDNPDCATTTDEEVCAGLSLECGRRVLIDACEQVREVECGTCEAGVCTSENQCLSLCEPETDIELCTANEARSCGLTQVMDRCGEMRTVDCGMCSGWERCVDGACACLSPTEQTLCGTANQQCGTLMTTDVCGDDREVTCGSCAEGMCLDNGTCSVCSPETDAAFCARVGIMCGPTVAPDNCGIERSVDCTLATGGCRAPAVCQADQQCRCPSETDDAFCSRQVTKGRECGDTVAAIDNCGQPRSVKCELGACTKDERCTNNRCVCPDVVCLVDDCGRKSNACGQSVNCGDTCN